MNMVPVNKKILLCSVAGVLAALTLSIRPARSQAAPRVIEVLADRDSRFKIAGQKQPPEITAKPGEELTLRITAVKAKNHNRDGSVHGFALLRVSDRQLVPGWDLLLKPGEQEFHLTAPNQVGDYIVICTVVCSQSHEEMTIKFVVEP